MYELERLPYPILFNRMFRIRACLQKFLCKMSMLLFHKLYFGMKCGAEKKASVADIFSTKYEHKN